MARQEKTYQGELKRSFDYYLRNTKTAGLWWKIPDTGYGKKPYDSWCLTGGQFYAMEQKICKAISTFNFRSFFRDREHEITALKRTEDAGGLAYVTINHYQIRKINKAYAMRVGVAERALSKGSVKLDDFIKHSEVIEIPRIKSDLNEYVWDLSVLFNNK